MKGKVLAGLALGVLGTLPLLLAAAPSQAAQQRQVLRVNVFTPDAALVAARAQGFFAAENLEIELTITPNSTAQMRGLSDGTFDIAFTAFDNVLAWSGREGAEIVAVAQTEAAPSLPVFVRPEITSWEQLRGRPLAVDAVDTAFALVLRRVLLEQGLDLQRGDYTLVPEGATQQRFESMTRGDTFAGILGAPWDSRGAAAGLVRMADHLAVLPDYPGSTVAVNRVWADANPDAVVRFLRAWLAGQRWVAANPQAAAALLATELNTTPEVAAGRLAALNSSPMLNMAGLQSVLDLRTMFGFRLLQGDDLARYVEPRFVRMATGS